MLGTANVEHDRQKVGSEEIEGNSRDQGQKLSWAGKEEKLRWAKWED